MPATVSTLASAAPTAAILGAFGARPMTAVDAANMTTLLIQARGGSAAISSAVRAALGLPALQTSPIPTSPASGAASSHVITKNMTAVQRRVALGVTATRGPLMLLAPVSVRTGTGPVQAMGRSISPAASPQARALTQAASSDQLGQAALVNAAVARNSPALPALLVRLTMLRAQNVIQGMFLSDGYADSSAAPGGLGDPPYRAALHAAGMTAANANPKILTYLATLPNDRQREGALAAFAATSGNMDPRYPAFLRPSLDGETLKGFNTVLAMSA